MGCIQSITCKARIRRENIVVYDVCATIDQCPTRIEETSPIVLRYKTPYFKASARVVMPPIPRHETWVVGWIQACNQMEFFNTYSDLGIRRSTTRPTSVLVLAVLDTCRALTPDARLVLSLSPPDSAGSDSVPLLCLRKHPSRAAVGLSAPHQEPGSWAGDRPCDPSRTAPGTR
uniref:Family with sequence similarity 78 member B n=1 Tax=Urocitellus parryii TaxID=9999 RepID=A0A8D2IJR0_UROPR